MFTQPAVKPVTEDAIELDLRQRPVNVIINDDVSYPFAYRIFGDTAGLVARMTFSAMSPSVPVGDVVFKSDTSTPTYPMVATNYPATDTTQHYTQYAGELSVADMQRLGKTFTYVFDVIEASGKVRRIVPGKVIRKSAWGI